MKNKKEIHFVCKHCFYQHDKGNKNSYGYHEFNTNEWHSHPHRTGPHRPTEVRVEAICPRCGNATNTTFSLNHIFDMVMTEER